jgi:hypothetical protein
MGDVEVEPVRIALPEGRTLVVRPIEPSDAAGLGALYDGLTPEDRHRRFFSVLRPPPRLLERMATIGDRGGFGLAAIVEDEGLAGDGHLVAVADYAPLPNGDGELSITVEEHWRGWLGPYLLDALVSEAAARGVPHLEADVLVTNREMLVLAHLRGAVTIGQPDPTIVRLLFATASRTPGWPGPHDRFRLLIEGHGGCWHDGDDDAPAVQTVVCSRPGPHLPPCPALAGERCPLAAGADAIVVSHGADAEVCAALREAHASLHPGPTILSTVPGPD